MLNSKFKLYFILLLLNFHFIHSAFAAASENETDRLLKNLDGTTTKKSEKGRSRIGPWEYGGNSRASQMLPDISLIGTVAGGVFTNDPVGDTGHDPARTGFSLQEIEVALQSNIDPYFRGDAFLVFGEDAVEVEEAYFTTLNFLKGFQARVGKMRLPFGRHNPKHLELWTFVDNMMPHRILLGPEGLNEMGIETSYVLPIPFFFEIKGYFTDGANDISFGGTRKQDFLYGGRLTTSIDLSNVTTLLWGASGNFGNNANSPGDLTMMFGGDILLKWKPSARTSLSWQSEYITRRMQNAGVTQSDGGFYTYVDWQFAMRWHTALRYEHMGIPNDVFGREWRVTPAFAFDPTEFSRFRIQYTYDKTVGGIVAHSAFVQAQFNMGPHGAHPF